MGRDGLCDGCGRTIDEITAFKELDVALWLWAIAHMAPLSLADPTRLPVLMRFWVCANSMLEALRFCRAMRAPTFIIT